MPDQHTCECKNCGATMTAQFAVPVGPRPGQWFYRCQDCIMRAWGIEVSKYARLTAADIAVYVEYIEADIERYRRGGVTPRVLAARAALRGLGDLDGR